jgi:hypothetical protein
MPRNLKPETGNLKVEIGAARVLSIALRKTLRGWLRGRLKSK